MHKYGNYFFKSLIINSSPVQRLREIKAIQSVIVDACFNGFGIHPMQALLSLQLSKEEENIIRIGLQGKLVELAQVYF